MIRPVFLLTSFFLLSGCSTTDWAAINKQVSDTAANLTKTLGGNSSGESGGMPLMSPARQQAMQSVQVQCRNEPAKTERMDFYIVIADRLQA